MNARPDLASVWKDVVAIRATRPLIHNITNYVVMNTTANALLALGAAPVMAHAMEEVREIIAMASALVVNIGTLSRPWVEAMLEAALAARQRGIPVVLDPVGAGATQFRTAVACEIIETASPAVVRGNASEILALCTNINKTRGVDSGAASEEAIDAAQTLSERHGCVVSVSGVVDRIVHRGTIIEVHDGSSMMPRVTGMGCTASALTAAFLAVNPSPFHAAAHAMAVMGATGRVAAARSRGPGSFQVEFLDVLYQLSEEDLAVPSTAGSVP